MLQSLREKAQGWLAWTIITLIAITFVLFGASNFLDTNPEQQVAAKVNGQKITLRELDIAYDNLLQQPGNEAVRGLDQKTVKKELLQSMIDQTLMTQRAIRSGMRISAQYVSNTIKSFPFLQVDHQFSQEAYYRLLSHYNYTDKSFRKLVGEDLLRGQLQEGISQTAFATLADIDRAIVLIQQQRSYRISYFPRKSYTKGVTVSKDDIDQFYKAHLEDYKTDEKIKLAYLVLSLPEMAKRYQPSEKDIDTYYKTHLTDFTHPEKYHIAHILAAVPQNADKEADAKANAKILSVQNQIKQGRSFADLAKTESDDSVSAQNGGVLAWLSKGDLPEIEGGIAQLKPGQLSAPIRTRFGYHIVQLLERHPHKVDSLSAVKDQIQDQLKNQMAEEKFMQAVDELGTLTYDSPDSLQPAADKLGLPMHTTALFGQKEGPPEPILKSQAVLTAAFSPSVLEDKNNSDVIKIDDSNYVVIRAMEYVPRLQMPLADVSEAVMKRLIDDRSSELAKEAALEAQSSLLEAKSTLLPDVMQKYTWEEKTDVTRFDTAINTDILKGVFSLPGNSDSDDRVMKAVAFDQGDYALVWVTNVKNGQIKNISEEEKEGYMTTLSRHLGELDYLLFVKGVAEQAKIVNKLDK